VIARRTPSLAALLAALPAHGIFAQSAALDSGRVRSLNEVDERPVLLAQPRPAYRSCLQDAGVRGREVVRFIIDTAGLVEPGSIDVEDPGQPILDSLAVAAARGLVFQPARASGQAVRIRVTLPFDFGTTAAAPAPGDSGVFALDCVDREPSVRSMPVPSYPETMVHDRIAGDVLFELVIDADGKVDRHSIRLVQASQSTFASVARTAVERARFAPALLGGDSVRCRLRLPVIFLIGREGEPAPKRERKAGELDAVVVIAWAR